MTFVHLAKAAFCLALAFAVVMACLPQPPALPADVGDKVLHMIAFATLALLARLGWPDASNWTILLSLSAFGALIEVVQLIPSLHREGDVRDWIADTVAAAAVLLALQPLRGMLPQE